MNREIGSEFDIPIEALLKASNLLTQKVFQEKIFCKNVTDIAYLSNGRTAIKFILSHIMKKKRINKCWLPSYLCETIIQPFKELNLNYEFYNVKENLQLDIDYLSKRIKKNDLILTLYYFGFPPNGEIINYFIKLKDDNIIILEDLTHSFLSRNIYLNKLGNYSIISLRKWFGIPDGGVAISNEDLFDKDIIIKKPFDEFVNLRLKFSVLKNFYIKKIIDKNNSFRKIHNKAEELANSVIDLNMMSNLSKAILDTVDFNAIIYKRRKNYNYLSSFIHSLNKIIILFPTLPDNVCPLNFPVIVEKRDSLRKFLVNNNIYCPIHWPLPEDIPKKFSYSYYLSKNILSIPCDQRYSTEDMKIIINKINDFYQKK
ncbi:hypothetical protein CVT91_00545 [Candidatus Atribacteria bacterium HGW-Atribacteria-1]|nr:MAG: hypothetical protein CVT91_00545 [Candidatus Atribacteria bacterium HGW-Atribacteria-1]